MDGRGRLPVFVPVTVLPLLHQRVASIPEMLATYAADSGQRFDLPLPLAQSPEQAVRRNVRP